MIKAVVRAVVGVKITFKKSRLDREVNLKADVGVRGYS